MAYELPVIYNEYENSIYKVIFNINIYNKILLN